MKDISGYVFRTKEEKNYAELCTNEYNRFAEYCASIQNKMQEIDSDSPDMSYYQALFDKYEGNMNTYAMMIEDALSPEHVFSAEELSTGAQTTTMEEELRSIAEHADSVETAEYVEDLIALNESTDDAVRFAIQACNELDNAEKAMEAALACYDASLALGKDFDVNRDIPAATFAEITPEMEQNIEEIKADVTNWRAYMGTSEMKDAQKTAQEIADNYAGKHPVKYVAYSVADIISEAHEARKCFVAENGNFIDNMRKAATAAVMRTSETLSPVKDSVMETMRSGVEDAAKGLNDAATKCMEISTTAKDFLVESARDMVKFSAKTADLITFGAYSEIMKKSAKNAEKRIEAYEQNPGEKTGMQRLSYNMDRFMTCMNKKIRGKEAEEFYKDVQDDGFLWGSVKDDAGKELCYIKSPAMEAKESLDATMESAKAFGAKTLGELSDAKDTVVEKMDSFATKAINKCVDISKEVSAKRLDMQADFAERTANSCAKQERRINSKITKLTEIDKKLFDIKEQLNQTLNTLNGVTPYKKQEYTPDKHNVEAIALLRQAVPSKRVDFAIKQIESAMKHDKRMSGVKEALKSVPQNLKAGAANVASMAVGYVYGNVEQKMTICTERMEKASEKLKDVQADIKKFNSMETIAKSEASVVRSEKTSQAQELDNSKDERDDL